MTLVQSEPKAIKIWTTDVKAVYLWTTKVRPSTMPAWIYHNATLGLISLSSDGSSWYTITDKNLGATTVYNQWDTLTDANCGKFYQRGNNYWFPHSWSVTTSSTRVNASNYWPWNYYSSSTFIKRTSSPYDRSSVQNDNLWGATTWTNEAMQWPCPNGFHVPTKDEWQAVYNILITTFWLANSATTMWTYLKMPLAWYRDYYNAIVSSVGSYGYYRNSTPDNANNAYDLFFYSSGIFPQDSNPRAYGLSVRCFKNDAVQPDDSRTKLK